VLQLEAIAPRLDASHADAVRVVDCGGAGVRGDGGCGGEGRDKVGGAIGGAGLVVGVVLVAGVVAGAGGGGGCGGEVGGAVAIVVVAIV